MTDEQLDAVIKKMEEVVRAGVTVTYAEYEELPREAKAALILAREQDRAELAAMIGRACSGQKGLREIMSRFDDGDALVELEIVAALERYAAPKD